MDSTVVDTDLHFFLSAELVEWSRVCGVVIHATSTHHKRDIDIVKCWNGKLQDDALCSEIKGVFMIARKTTTTQV